MILFLIILLIFIGGCGDHGQPFNDNVGFLKAVVLNSNTFNPNISHGQIVKYKVTITAADMAEPVSAIFEGTASSGLIDGIPAGKDRILEIEAINPNDIKIREGKTDSIEIIGGETTTVQATMDGVPIFANIKSGNIIPNTRFVAKIFSDPNDPVTIQDEFQETTLPLFDIILTEISTGLANITPPLMPAGPHKLTIKNNRTGKSSMVDIVLTDGSKIKAATIFSAGGLHPSEQFGMTVFGY